MPPQILKSLKFFVPHSQQLHVTNMYVLAWSWRDSSSE